MCRLFAKGILIKQIAPALGELASGSARWPLYYLRAAQFDKSAFMWALDNKTAYAAARNWVRDKRGMHYWVVSVKATFDMTTSGRPTLSDVQTPPAIVPEYFGKPGASSVRWDSDLLAVKPCTDVIANATAYAPTGKKSESVHVSLRVGDLTKSLIVYGSRVYYKRFIGGLATTRPQPFESRPIRYEQAFGGIDMRDADPRRHRIDLRNPIGCGFATSADHLLDKEAPTIAYQTGDDASLGPAGFGAVDAAWSPRRELAGTYDEAWARTKKPLLADDYDDLHASCAPLDQRAMQLRGGEPVEILNLTPERVLRFDLPKVYLTFTTHFGRRQEEHRSHLTTVLFEPDAKSFALVWQTALPVHARDGEYLDQTTIREKAYVR